MSGTNSANNPDDDDMPDVSAPDDMSALLMWLQDKLQPDDYSTAETLVVNLVESFGSGSPDDDDDDETASDKLRKPRIGILAAKDSKMINRDTIRELNAIRQAESETGILGMDSAFATYATALKRQGIDTRSLGGSAAAARQLFRLSRNAPARPMAADSVAQTSRSAMFPNGGRLRTGYY